MIVDWRRWGLGGSVTFAHGGVQLRLWLGPIRTGWAYDRRPESEAP